MSLLDDVSIVVTPNGYKAGTLYGVIPSSGAADMDVTRATASTRVDENGLVNYAEVLGSEEVENGDGSSTTGWDLAYANTTLSLNNNNLRATANASDAYGLSQDLSLDTSKQYIIKATINVDNASGGAANLRIATNSNLSSGVTTLSSTTGSSTTILSPSAATMYIGIVDTANDSSNYVEIDNISVKEIDRNNVPRIDYTGGGCPHILAEPQRTNLFTYSEDFSSWSNDNSTDTPNSTTAPDGTLTATEVTEDTATGRHGVFYNIGSQTGTEFSFSAFVKDNNRRYVSIVLSDIATWNSMVVFDLTTGTITKEYTKTGYTGTSSITAIGNGWYRISNTLTGLAFTGSTVYSRIYLQDTPTPANPPSNTYTGDGLSLIHI